MSLTDHFINDPPRAILTDVFGTVVNWRKTVTNHLAGEAHRALNSASASIPTSVRMVVDGIVWEAFAEQWRKSYYGFTHSYNPDTMPFKTIDEHHFESLQQLLEEYQLQGLWTDQEIRQISLIWHKLEPWPDSKEGLDKLNTKFLTATLSNGGRSLLENLCANGKLTYTQILSAEDFRAYKPDPRVYLGAAQALPQCAPSDCCLVAAHLADLTAAKACGFKTVYIERPQEEFLAASEIENARRDGLVDVWITADEDGFMTLAKMLDS